MTMDTASFQFVLFGLAVALVSNLSRSRVWRSIVMMGASLLFLATLEKNPLEFVPLLGFLLLGYVALVLVRKGMPRTMASSVVTVVIVYIWLKKYTFFPGVLLLHSAYFTLGLSYIFFRVLHLIIETGDAIDKPKVGLFEYLLYTLNFTTLVSGPIQRYEDFARDQFAREPPSLGPRVIGLQLERIVRGFFKVNVLAMLFDAIRLDALAEMSYSLPPGMKFYAGFRLAIAYPLFLYANFSGYIDIVIALARLMRVRLPENFDRPFSATSVLEFWNQWHITLSNWLKNYVYNPLLLALMRRISSLALQPLLGVFCFFVTFFLIGLWHGRTSEFIFFGVLTGGGMSINKLWQLGLTGWMGKKGYRALANNSIYIALARGLNYVWFAFTLFWFWGSWTQIGDAFSALGLPGWVAVWAAAWLSASVVLALWEGLRSALLSVRTVEGPMLLSRYARVVYASALGLAAFVITVLLNQPAPGIVYRAF